ncbi:WD domain, G-beta repeat, putative [Trypanosoma equiperdum]|nr:WD domain, G-beta repeat, putative [Trypanosoma equiperdum]
MEKEKEETIDEDGDDLQDILSNKKGAKQASPRNEQGVSPESRRGRTTALVAGQKTEELAAAMAAENHAIRQAAHEAKEAAQQNERRRAEEEREREALERRELRRKEREEKRNKRGNDSKATTGPLGTSAFAAEDLQRQGYVTQFDKDLQRATALRRLVDMDDVAAALVDAPPQSQYDMYIRSFGESGRKQVGVQNPAEEDRTDVGVQAERVRVKSRGVEVPRDLGLCPELHTNNVAQFTTGKGGTDGGTVTENTQQQQFADGALLAGFLNRVFPIIRAAMDENEGVGSDATKAKSETQFSSSCVSFCFSAARNRPVLKVLFNPCNPTYIVALHGSCVEEGPSKEMDRYMSVILLWSIYDNTAPEKVLVSPSVITCISASPRKPYLIYGGSEDGSVFLWDTREPERNHTTAGRYEGHRFRLPSFSTSWQAGNHLAPLVSVTVAGYNTATGIRKDEAEQLVSLDAFGETHFWVVNEKDQAKGAIIDNENGLNMFSTVRLLLAASKGSDRANSASLSQEAFAIDFVPSDPSHYVVACAEGVRHISRFGSVAAPSVYGPSSRFFNQPIVVPSCVQYNPVDNRILMVGYDDGSVRVYLHTEGSPQISIPLSTHRVTEIRCSLMDKWLYWVLDAGGMFYLLDLAKGERELPVFSQSLSQTNAGICTCFDTPPEAKAESRMVVFGFEKGEVQLHTLNDLTHSLNPDRNELWL